MRLRQLRGLTDAQKEVLAEALRTEPQVIAWQQGLEAATAEAYGRPGGRGFGLKQTEVILAAVMLEPSQRKLAMDLATATGVVPIHLVKSMGFERAIGVELRPDAVRIARRDAAGNGVGDKVRIVHSNLLRYNFGKEASLVSMTLVLHFIPEELKGPLVRLMMGSTIRGGLNVHVALSSLKDGKGNELVSGIEPVLRAFYEDSGWAIERHAVEPGGIHKVTGGPMELTRLVARKP